MEIEFVRDLYKELEIFANRNEIQVLIKAINMNTATRATSVENNGIRLVEFIVRGDLPGEVDSGIGGPTGHGEKDKED